ncbi:MAG TPA: hypothetical protein VFZ40_08330 [Pyrinomonadaceae bacterium]
MLVTGPKISLMVGLVGFVLLVGSACSRGAANAVPDASALSEDEKHRIYAAALAASDSPLETEAFKAACRKIGIFDANGKPNDDYMAFVSEHVNWGTKSETDQFRREIDSKEKAREYIRKHLATP